MDRVIRALRAAGGATVTVETGGYNLSPVYRQPSRTQNEIATIEAYRAVNHVRVRADDLTRVGGLIDAAIAAGANRIASLTFEARDPEPARWTRCAPLWPRPDPRPRRWRARWGSTSAADRGPDQRGLRVPTPMPMYRSIARGQAAAPTPVEPGEQVVRANVTIRYRLLER